MSRTCALLLLGGSLVVSCRRAPAPGSRPAADAAAPATRVTLVTERPSLEQIAKMPLEEGQRRIDDVYRLKPDRRFLIALGELDILLTGVPNARIGVAFRDGGWDVFSGTDRVGRVSEFPEYAELRRALREHARTRLDASRAREEPGTAERSIREASKGFRADRIIATLSSADKDWPIGSRPSVATASAAGQALTFLLLQTADRLEMSDLLAGRTLMWVALADALGAPASPEDDALLAWSLGYIEDAKRCARSIDPARPVRRFVEGMDEIPEGLPPSRPEDPVAAYLTLLDVTRRNDARGWSSWVELAYPDESLSLPVLRSALEVDVYEMKFGAANATLHAVIRDIAPVKEDSEEGSAGPSGTPLADEIVERFVKQVRGRRRIPGAGLIRTFESNLATRCGSVVGPIWDASICRAYYRGFFYSGLYNLGLFHVDSVSDVPSASALAEYLRDSPPGPAAQFGRWYANIAAVDAGRPFEEPNFRDLTELTELGAPAMARTARDAGGYFPSRHVVAEIAERFARRLDTRPSHLAILANVARKDVALVERLRRAWLARAADTDVVFRTDSLKLLGMGAHFLDPAAVLAAVSDRRRDPGRRAQELLDYAYAVGPARCGICRENFRALGAESGYDRSVTWAWIDWAERIGDVREDRRAVEGWLGHHSPDDGVLWHVYRGRLAHLASEGGRPREAWAIIQPSLASSQAAVMAWGAEILEKLGRREESYQLARTLIDQYPGSREARCMVAKQLWKSHRYSEAALVVDPPEAPYKPDGVDIATSFIEVFRDQSDDSVNAALEALRAQGIKPGSLELIASEFAKENRWELAFQIKTATMGEGHQHRWHLARWKRQGAEYLEKWKGRAQAMAWLQKSIPKPAREPSLESYFQDRQFALLWDAVPPEEEPGVSEWVWLLRAGALVMGDPFARGRKAEIEAHFMRPGVLRGSEEGPRAIGRHVLGLETRTAAISAARSPEDRCRAAYFFGLKELSDGNYPEGSRWLQLVYGTCPRPSWKLVTFAEATLQRWEGSSLAFAAERKNW